MLYFIPISFMYISVHNMHVRDKWRYEQTFFNASIRRYDLVVDMTLYEFE